MSKEKIKLLVLAIAIPVLLFVALFIPSAYCRIIAAVVLALAAGLVLTLIKKKGIPSINYRTVTGLMAVIAVLYLVLIYVSGMWLGFYRNDTLAKGGGFVKLVIPTVVIIVAIELVRSRLLAQSKKWIDITLYVGCIFADILLAGGIAQVTEISKLLDVVGLALFPAITANLMLHYIAKRHGSIPCIAYRMIMTVPAMLLPITPAISDALQSFILILLPLGIGAFIKALFEKRTKAAKKKESKWSYVWFGGALAVMAAIIMLISGQFGYKLLVIATPSMTGEINQGDAIIYKAYDDEIVNKGDVIVFEKGDNSLIVHRVVDIQKIDGNVYYTTKGDANSDADAGFVVEENIRGIVKCKVSHIGHPSLWLRELFK